MNARRVVLLLLFALMEACLVAPVLILLPTPLQSTSQAMALGVTWLALCAVAGTRQWLAARDIRIGIQRIAMGWWLIAILCAFTLVKIASQGSQAFDPIALIIQFVAAALVWWRGAAVGRAELSPAETQQRFHIGLMLFGGYVIVMLVRPLYDMLPFVLPFLFSALFAQPLSYLERVQQTEEGHPVPMTWRWWRSILLSAGLALLVSLAVMAVLTPELLFRALGLLVGAIFLPLVLLLGLLLDPLIHLIRPLANQPAQNPITAGGLGASQQLPQQTTASSPLVISSQTGFILMIGLLCAIILVMALMTARARRQPVRVRQDSGAQDTPGPAAESDYNRVALSRILDLRRWLAGISVRRLYARMTHEAARRGFARAAAQTPYDYLPQLNKAFPGADAEVRLITDVYVATHYGEAPETDEELAEIRAAWERTRASHAS